MEVKHKMILVYVAAMVLTWLGLFLFFLGSKYCVKSVDKGEDWLKGIKERGKEWKTPLILAGVMAGVWGTAVALLGLWAGSNVTIGHRFFYMVLLFVLLFIVFYLFGVLGGTELICADDAKSASITASIIFAVAIPALVLMGFIKRHHRATYLAYKYAVPKYTATQMEVGDVSGPYKTHEKPISLGTAIGQRKKFMDAVNYLV
jgi:MFS family permease